MSQNKKTVRRTVPNRKKSDAAKQKNRAVTAVLTTVLLAVSVVAVIALGINTVKAAKMGTVSNQGSEESMTANTGKSMKNTQYEIGNNPTEISKEYFQKLTDAVKEGTAEQKAEAVVYNFVTDYFTWTNKDGNYEVGGLQYIYAEKYAKFEEWNRWYPYSDMDLYISQYGRDHLPEVAEISTEVPAFRTDDFTVNSVDPPMTYPCYQVQVSWTYKPDATVNLSEFPHRMRFLVVDHDGRFEIAEFYDMESVEAWEAENGSGSTSVTESGGN
jgi:hypothetical protein